MRPTPFPTLLAVLLAVALLSPIRAHADEQGADTPAAAPQTGSAAPGALAPAVEAAPTAPDERAQADAALYQLWRERKAAMDAELDALFAAERAAVAELRSQLSTIADDIAALALIQQIEERKRQAELDCMRIQVRHAREAGLQQQALELEAELERMLHPESAAQAPATSAAASVETQRPTPDAKE